jgi:hypothetical protein
VEVSGHEFIRAVPRLYNPGFSPCGFEVSGHPRPHALVLDFQRTFLLPAWAGLNFADFCHYWQFWQYRNKVTSQLTLHPLLPPPQATHGIPLWRGFIPVLPRTPSRPTLPPGIAAFYCLINRVMTYLTVLPRENKVRNSAGNYFLLPAFFFAVWFFHPPHVWRRQGHAGYVFRPWPWLGTQALTEAKS